MAPTVMVTNVGYMSRALLRKTPQKCKVGIPEEGSAVKWSPPEVAVVLAPCPRPLPFVLSGLVLRIHCQSPVELLEQHFLNF